MKSLFKPIFTKWEPVLIYDSIGDKYLLQCRRNIKSGKLHFKNSKLNRWGGASMNGMPCNIFDPKEQFQKILTSTDSFLSPNQLKIER